MRSAIRIFSGDHNTLTFYKTSWAGFLEKVQQFSDSSGHKAEIIIQHDLKRDRIAIVVESGKRVFHAASPAFAVAVSKLITKLGRANEELLAKKKQAAGEEGSKGPRRKGPEGQRLKRLRKG